MPDQSDSILARLAGQENNDGGQSWADLEAKPPEDEEVGARVVTDGTDAGADTLGAPVAPPARAATPSDQALDNIMNRINQLVDPIAPAKAADVTTPGTTLTPGTTPDGDYYPVEPTSFAEAGISDSEVEALVLKFLLGRSEGSGRVIADQVKLSFLLIEVLLNSMKYERLVGHRGSAAMNDYVYELTDIGRERARRHVGHCSYFGAAPVPLSQYSPSVAAQSLTKQHPMVDDLKRAFSDLLIGPNMLKRLGPAINSGRGLFLFGAPGNGKTSIAERVTAAFGETIWIPRSLGIDGEIMRLFDPSNHEEAPLSESGRLLDQAKIDRRWVRIRRPTIIVGGELTMDSLEVAFNTSTGISESPVQLKSNCGTLVIDDFGRQRMSTDELLNRWIVPLEKRYDYLNLANGKKIEVPFDQLIIFSTNLEPRDLVDDAFLRRIPYKIEVIDPTEEQFRELFEIMAPRLDLEYNDAAVTYLIETHYKAVQRPFRCCQPRDLILQIRNFCQYAGTEPRMTNELMDEAVENYFAVM